MAYKSYIGDRYVGTDAERQTLNNVTNGSLFVTTDTLTVFMRVSDQWSAVGAASMEDLVNVNVDNPQDEQILAYNESTGQWENTTVTALLDQDKTLGELTNVAAGADTPLTDHDFLKWNGTEWEPHQLVEADISDLQDYALQTTLENDYQLRSEKGEADGYAPLNSNSKIDLQYLPALAITEVFVVADIAERDTTLIPGPDEGQVQSGDVAVVLDASGDPNVGQGSASYIYATDAGAGSPGWVKLKTPDVTAPGADTQVIFNDSGEFGASADFTFDDGLLTLSEGRLRMTDIGTYTDGTLPSGEAIYYTITGEEGGASFTRMMARIGDEDFIVATHNDAV